MILLLLCFVAMAAATEPEDSVGLRGFDDSESDEYEYYSEELEDSNEEDELLDSDLKERDGRLYRDAELHRDLQNRFFRNRRNILRRRRQRNARNRQFLARVNRNRLNNKNLSKTTTTTTSMREDGTMLRMGFKKSKTTMMTMVGLMRL